MKETGLGWSALTVDDASGTLRDIRNDIGNFQISTPRGVQDVTGIDKFAMERLLLLADLSVTLNGAAFNDASNMSHAVFSSVPSTSVARQLTCTVSGQTLGTTPQVEILFTDYSLNRAQDGALTWAAPGVLANGEVPTWTSA